MYYAIYSIGGRYYKSLFYTPTRYKKCLEDYVTSRSKSYIVVHKDQLPLYGISPLSNAEELEFEELYGREY
jgi:hypothetical protein